MSRTATPRLASGGPGRREDIPKAPPSGRKLRWHAASMMFLLAILVLLLVVQTYLTRAGYLMPVPPIT